MDDYVFEFRGRWGRGVDDFEEHGAFVLVEPFGRFVDVIVGSCVGPSYDLVVVLIELLLVGMKGVMYHDCNIVVVNTVIVDRWLQEVGVLFEPVAVLASAIAIEYGWRNVPLWQIQRSCKHFGKFLAMYFS